ncbi:MAG: hypothetical protein IPK97_08195 [Ahniella sp.]|nr:hypothetical protein [Ahniella sp.]
MIAGVFEDWSDTLRGWLDLPARRAALAAWRHRRRHFSASRRVLFYDKLHDFCAQGRRVSLREALVELHQRAVEDGDRKQDVLGRILNELKHNPTLTTLALKPYLPPSEFTMLFAADEAGRIAEGLANARDAARQVSEIVGELRAALAGPAASLLMLMGVVYALPGMVVEVLLDLVPRDRWPDFSRPMLWLSEYVPSHGHWLLLAVIVVGWRVAVVLPTWVGSTRTRLDQHMMPWSLYRSYQGATTMIALSGLKRSGRGLRHALEGIVHESTPWLRQHLEEMILRLSMQGATVVQAMDTGLLDRDVMRNLRDYARADAETKALELLGADCVKQLRSRISWLSTWARFGTMTALVLVFLYINRAVYAVTLSAQDYVQELQNGIP